MAAFYASYVSYQEDALTAAFRKPAGDLEEKWNGPYLKKRTIPKDPWNRDYHYVSPGENGLYDLYSLGLDNAAGGEGDNADINSWD